MYRPKNRDCYSSIHVDFDDQVHGKTTVQVEGESYDYGSFLKTLHQRRDECDEAEPSPNQHTVPIQSSSSLPVPPAQPPVHMPVVAQPQAQPQAPLRRSVRTRDDDE